MKVLLAFFICLFFIGCGQEAAVERNPFAGKIDQDGSFAQLLNEVDKKIGTRFQSMEMEAMVSATYMYDGALEEITKIVDPLITEMGYSAVDTNTTEELPAAAKEMQEKMGMKMKNMQSQAYKHKNGNMISVSRMDISHSDKDMSMLTVHLMNPKLMSKIGGAVGQKEQ